MRVAHISHAKLKVVNFVATQHNALVSSNFCKELDFARFYQRAFFCPDFRATCGVPVPPSAPVCQRSGHLFAVALLFLISTN
jgi:hypothetical protein